MRTAQATPSGMAEKDEMLMLRTHTARPPRARTRRRSLVGFTLLEVLVASAIVGVAFVSVTNSMSAATTSKAALSGEPFLATQLAKEIHTLSKTLPREPSGDEGAKTAAEVTALDSLIDADFDPPLLADMTQDASLAGWRQRVSLDVFAINDLTTPTGEDPASLFGSFSPRVFQLSVTIKQNGQDAGTFTWWITP